MHTPGGWPTSRQAGNLADGLPQLRTAPEAKAAAAAAIAEAGRNECADV